MELDLGRGRFIAGLLAGRPGRAPWPKASRPRCGEHRRAQRPLSGRQPLLRGLLRVPRPACSAVQPGCTNFMAFCSSRFQPAVRPGENSKVALKPERKPKGYVPNGARRARFRRANDVTS